LGLPPKEGVTHTHGLSKKKPDEQIGEFVAKELTEIAEGPPTKGERIK